MAKRKKRAAKKITRRRPSRTAARTTKRRRRNPAAGKVKLSVAGLKRALKPEGVLYALMGASLARILYGWIMENYPQDDMLVKMGAAIGTTAAAISISGKAKIVIPVATGAAAITLLDSLSTAVAGSIAEYSPGAAYALAAGMDNVPMMQTPAPAKSNPVNSLAGYEYMGPPGLYDVAMLPGAGLYG